MKRPARFIRTQVEVEGRVETKVVEVPSSNPEPWDQDAELTVVGQPTRRVDGPAKVGGTARYTADVARPGMLYAVIVRSTIAHANVRSLDLSAARAFDGVVDVVDGRDLTSPIRVGGLPLFPSVVSYVGQPIAAICATSVRAARAAAKRVRVDYEPLPARLGVQGATDATLPPLRASGNLLGGKPSVVERGNVEAGLAQAAVTITREYATPSALHSALEPHGAVAEWEGDQLTLWESTQGIFRVRNQLAAAFGIPQAQVRVIMQYMGGGFGAKNAAGTHSFVAALLARRTGKPVSCILDRTSEQTDTGHRPSSTQRVTIGAAADGTLTAIEARVEIPLGMDGWEASATAIYHQMYRCPNVRTHETWAYVNQQPMQAFRAPGHAEGAFALERAMDCVAHALKMDPLELRRKNFAMSDEEKQRPYSANLLLECYAEGARRFDWAGRELRRNGTAADSKAARSGSGRGTFPAGGPPRNIKRGFGLASQIWAAGGGPPAYATVRINGDGSVDVLTGTQDLGTGPRTIFAQIAAEALGARVSDVRVHLGDTERTPYTGNSWGSMTTASVGPAVRAAAEEARLGLLDAAAELHNAERDTLHTRDSQIWRDGSIALASFRDITRKLGNVTILGHGSRGPNPAGIGLVSLGAHFAEVEVDIDTGVVRVVKIVAVHDVGRVINPLLAQSQLEGGILQGLGYALFEERIVDQRTGKPVNTSLHDYKIPTFADCPVIDAHCLDRADVIANHVGARGLAEPPVIPVAPAIANAVADALGVEVNAIPLTPWRVIAAVHS